MKLHGSTHHLASTIINSQSWLICQSTFFTGLVTYYCISYLLLCNKLLQNLVA